MQLRQLHALVYILTAIAGVLAALLGYTLLNQRERGEANRPTQATSASADLVAPAEPLEAVTNAQLGVNDLPSYPSIRPLTRRTQTPEWADVIELHENVKMLALKIYDVQVDAAKMKTELRELRARVNERSAR